MTVKGIVALLFISVLIIDKVELYTEYDLLKQCKTFVKMIYTDKEVLIEVLYRYIYTVTL